jgi:hypothetical protein
MSAHDILAWGFPLLGLAALGSFPFALRAAGNASRKVRK